MVVSAKSLSRGNLGRNFAEHRGTADLLQTDDTEVIISAVTTGSRPYMGALGPGPRAFFYLILHFTLAAVLVFSQKNKKNIVFSLHE